MTVFYLGTPEPSWLRRAAYLRLFVSHARLSRLVNPFRAAVPWALDSGGFMELRDHGAWRITPRDYVAAVARYDREVGMLEWAAPMDWMCESFIVERTGLSAAEHQLRTVDNYVELRKLWPDYSDETCPIMPVLQGDPDGPVDGPVGHLACVELYEAAGVDLGAVELLGLGSVCRQENTEHIGATITAIAQRLPDVPLHGFGVKSRGLGRYGHLLDSADSQAWSMGARRRKHERQPECVHPGPCTWCPHRALAWRDGVLDALGQPGTLAHFPEHRQPAWWPAPGALSRPPR